jgi:hypothetical protein
MQVALGNVLKEDGVRGLFTGAGPRSVWWFCVCSVFFASFERIRTHIHKVCMAMAMVRHGKARQGKARQGAHVCDVTRGPRMLCAEL